MHKSHSTIHHSHGVYCLIWNLTTVNLLLNWNSHYPIGPLWPCEIPKDEEPMYQPKTFQLDPFGSPFSSPLSLLLRALWKWDWYKSAPWERRQILPALQGHTGRVIPGLEMAKVNRLKTWSRWHCPELEVLQRTAEIYTWQRKRLKEPKQWVQTTEHCWMQQMVAYAGTFFLIHCNLTEWVIIVKEDQEYSRYNSLQLWGLTVRLSQSCTCFVIGW